MSIDTSLKPVSLSLFRVLPYSLLAASILPTPSWSLNSSLMQICQSTGNMGTKPCPKYQSPTTVQSTTPKANSFVGNPIHVLSGNKFEQAVDIDALGDDYALRLTRYYNSQSVQTGMFGVGWRSSFEMQLQDTGEFIEILQADGTKYRFDKQLIEHTNDIMTERFVATDKSLGYLSRANSDDNFGSSALWYWYIPDGRRIAFTAHKQIDIVNTQGRPRYGQLLSVHKNPNLKGSPYWQLTYDTKGRIAQVSNHLADFLKFHYQTHEDGSVTLTITNKDNQQYQYLLDKHNNLAKVYGHDNKVIGYEYNDPNDKHNLTAKYHHDSQGNKRLISQWQYDSHDRAILSSHDNKIGQVTIDYDKATNTQHSAEHIYTNTITNSLGQTTQYRYTYRHGDILLLSAMGAGCASCGEVNNSYDYDNQGRMSSMTHYDDQGAIVFQKRFVYDANNRITQEITQSSGNSSTINYTYVSDDPDHPLYQRISEQSTQSVHANHKTGIRYRYDEYGNIVHRSEFGYTQDGTPIERQFRFEYDRHGQPTHVYQLDEQGKSSLFIRYHWLDIGKLTKIEEPYRNMTTEFIHDAQGNIEHIVRSWDDHTLSFQIGYDAHHQPIFLSGKLDETSLGEVHYTKDSDGNITKVSDAKGTVLQSFDITKLSAMIDEVQTPFDRSLSDASDGGVITINQAGLKSYYRLDDFGRISSITHPTTGTQHYHYDSQDNIRRIHLSDGRTIHYDYQNQKLVSKKTYDHQGKLIAWVNKEYQQGRLVRQQEDHQEIQYRYNRAGQIISKTIYLTGLKTPLTTRFDYDKQGNLATIHLPDGIILSGKEDIISYQTQNKLGKTALYQRTANTSHPTYQLGSHIRINQTYDRLGRWTSLSYTDNTKPTHPTIKQSANSGTFFAEYWRRNGQGLIDRLSQRQQDSHTEYHYLYNDDEQLLMVNSQTNSPTGRRHLSEYYAYDVLGNRIGTQHRTSVGTTLLSRYHYDAKAKLASTPRHPIGYDETGRPTSYQDYQLSYHNGRLSAVHDTQGRPIASYRYNDLGQRIAKISWIDDKANRRSTPTTTYYVYEDSLLQHELDEQGSIKRHYVYVADQLIATLDYDTPKAPQDPISLWQRLGNRLSGTQTPKVNYVITDHLGRPRQVKNQDNQTIWQLHADTFGGKPDDRYAHTGYELNLRFAGQYADTETGLYYNHHRYYDPSTGRYLTPDPLGLAGGDNLYTYVNNSPIHYNDPIGLLLFAFDGTGNRDYNTKALSNVVKFRDAYTRDPNEPSFPNTKWRGQTEYFSNHMQNNNIFYIAGAGTEDKYTKIGSNGGSPSIWHLPDAGTGQSLTNRVDQMLIYMSDYLDKVIAERKDKQTKSDTTITLDIVGFSRGAASARMFASKLENLLSKDYNNKHPSQLPLLSPQYQSTHGTYRWKHGTNNLCGIKIKFNFMGLWDTVPSYGITITDDSKELADKGYAITVSSKWNKVVHAVAVNEHRSGFAVRSIFNDQNQAKTYANSTKRIERGFLGAHSDIGGGYATGDLSDTALMWIIKQAEKSNVTIGRKWIAENNYHSTTNPVVHDNVGVYSLSQYKPSRQFLWATDGKGISQFESIAHLKLNWKDTLQFENDKSKKFEKVKRYSEEYLKLSQLPACSRKDGTCPTRSATDVMNDYNKLKANYSEEILHDTTVNERIKLAEYKKWLRENGYEID